MNNTKSITKGMLRALVKYNANTGQLVWRERGQEMFNCANAAKICASWNARYAGKQVGCNSNKGRDGGAEYVVCNLFNKTQRVHRLIWVYHFGEIPAGYLVDHINKNTLDNRISNLRLVTNLQNMQNKNASVVCQTGVRGVSPVKNRPGVYEVCVVKNGKRVYRKKIHGFLQAVAKRKSLELIHKAL